MSSKHHYNKLLTILSRFELEKMIILGDIKETISFIKPEERKKFYLS
jgi:metallophosphoesterase superfamily enzyme